jgi:hypothetical protein
LPGAEEGPGVVLKAEGHEGSDDRCAAYADVPEADSLGLFVTLVPARLGQHTILSEWK